MGLLVAGIWAGAARAREDEPPAQEAPGNAWQIDGVVVGTYQHTGQSEKRIQDDTERDYIMTADQGKEYGIIDDVIRKRA